MKRGEAAALLLGALLLGVAAPAFAQSASPSPKAPTVEGEVTGALARGSDLAFSVDATMPGGWEGLHEVQIVASANGQELERITYDIEDVQIKVGEQEIVSGTGAVAAGEYLRVSGADVVLTTGGGNLSFQVTADVVKTLPQTTRFELGVVDDHGNPTSVTRGIAEPPSKGLTWGTVVAFVAAALFAGGFIGNLFASKRRPPPRPSVYSALQRRIEAERTTAGSAEDR